MVLRLAPDHLGLVLAVVVVLANQAEDLAVLVVMEALAVVFLSVLLWRAVGLFLHITAMVVQEVTQHLLEVQALQAIQEESQRMATLVLVELEQTQVLQAEPEQTEIRALVELDVVLAP
jgi:hypothetical protein